MKALENNEVMVPPTSNELYHIKRDYLNEYSLSYIEDIQLVKGIGMKEDSWISVAVKFKNGLAKKQLISAITYLHADEYHGTHKGYHIFWYD